MTDLSLLHILRPQTEILISQITVVIIVPGWVLFPRASTCNLNVIVQRLQKFWSKLTLLLRCFLKRVIPISLCGPLLITQMNREDLLKEKSLLVRNNTAPLVTFILHFFSVQHHNLKHLIYKHWHILGIDRVLNIVLPTKPQVVYTGTPSLRNRISTNVFDPPAKNNIFF